ncbi:MAG TPA: ABC transporter permease [Blastocatellia bacterium]|nr:ABC transporter permease [Blastocatellia bacterium]
MASCSAPLPFKDPDRVVTLWQYNTKRGVKEKVSYANFLDWRDQNQVFEEMATIEPFSFDLTGQGAPEYYRSWLVTDGFFRILGVNALHGRIFAEEEYQTGNNQVVVISHNLWKRRFGSSLDLLGQTLTLDGMPCKVVGVMPPEFQFPAGRDFWAPKALTDRDKRGRARNYLQAIARLKPGVTVEQAREEMNAIAARLGEAYPQTNAEFMGATVVPLPEQLTGEVRPALLVLLGAVGFVLLIACANIANLMLARGAERQREFAIRAALGAARIRLIRQLFTESALIALLGGLGGVLLAGWVIDLLLALNPGNVPRFEQIGLDGRVLGFALGVSALTALIFGLAPALYFSRPNLNETLKEGGRSATAGLARQRLRNLLVVSEIALALVLLVGAGLLVRSFVSLLQVDPGFQADRVAAFQVHVWDKHPEPGQRAAFFEQTLEQIAALPGVQAAGAVSALPFIGVDSIDIDIAFTIEGQPVPAPGQEPNAYYTLATRNYFAAMGIPLLSGRSFTAYDNQQSAPVALINQAMARRYWPGEDPVGKKITVRYGRPTTREIIGVVGDVRHTGLDSEPRPEIYIPHPQQPDGSMSFVVRTSGDPAAIMAAVQDRIWSVNKDIAFPEIAPLHQLISQTLAQWRFNLLLLGSFAAIALMLAGVGIYGLISFSVSQRTHEIGVRVALGAEMRDILKMVLGEGMALALAGVGIGLAGAFALTRLMASMLFGVSATDPLTFAAVALLLVGVALLACYIPARRATKVDPMIALRHE